MNTADIVELILVDVRMQNLTRKVIDADGHLQVVSIDEAQKRKAAEAYLPIVVNKASTAHDFNFACDWTTVSGGTVANQADYNLTGKSNDARAIVRVLYGAYETALEYKRQADIDTSLSGLERPTSVMWWTDAMPVNGLPTVTLIGTPTVAGEQIKYRYWKTGITPEQWPDGEIGVIVDGVVARFLPEFREVYKDSLNSMIAGYLTPKNASQPMPLNTQLAWLNRLRNSRHGY